jgi:DUF1680 family protein
VFEESQYVDVLERTLYNALLSGCSLDGERFFYPNVLESKGAERASWFKCACCPSNLVRFLAQMPRFVFASRTLPGGVHELWVNLFVAGSATLKSGARTIRVQVATNHPWDDAAEIRIETAEPVYLALRIRNPGWAMGRALPGRLYRFESESGPATTTVSGDGAGDTAYTDDFDFAVGRTWKDGDRLRVQFEMPVERLLADERVEALRGRVALQRGPLVYAFEGLDQPHPAVADFVLADDAVFTPEWRENLLGGVTVLRGPARLATRRENGTRELGEPFTATAIPYFAWANRGKTPMSVWVQR